MTSERSLMTFYTTTTVAAADVGNFSIDAVDDDDDDDWRSYHLQINSKHHPCSQL